MTVPHAIRRFLPFLLLCLALAWPAPGNAQMAVGLTVSIAPPPLPVYADPPLPEDGYVFIPGYWAWGPAGYYWVPGTWVLPPAPGLLWTPGYWALAADGVSYVWYPGYWGPTVGFYGGVDYGFGYFGVGYVGGYWQDGFFVYNSEVHNFGRTHVSHMYGRDVPDQRGRTPRVGFAGEARGGVNARPSPDETRAAGEEHRPPRTVQTQHETQAATVKTAPLTVNHGTPRVAATQHPATFTGPGIVRAQPAPHPAGGGAPPHPAGGTPPAGHGGGGEPEHH